MSRIAGLVQRDPRRPMPADASARAALGEARRLDAAGALALAGGETLLARTPGGWVAASLDLTSIAGLTRDDPAALAALLGELAQPQGRRLLARLHGAFAIACWDAATRRLALAVDRFGFRRLYWSEDVHGLAFASAARGALDLAAAAPDADPEAVYAYLNLGTVPAPASIFRAVRRLAPGQLLSWRDGHVDVEPYWDMRYAERAWRLADAAAETARQAEAAVRECVADLEAKHVGAFLSGGTDSSTIVGLMGRVAAEPPQAFSIGFAEPRYDETAYAVLAARHFGAAHHTRLVSADDALACVPDLVDAYDEPFGNNSAIPTYLCARLARETGVTTLLAGDGGDEVFGGNERYRREQVLARYRLLPAPLRRHLLEPALRALPPGGLGLLGKAQRYAERAATPNPARFYASEFYVAHERARLLDPGFLRLVDPDAPTRVARRHYDAVAGAAELHRLMYIDLKITLGDNDLFKVTRTAERAGVDVRFPFLDHRLVEFTGTLPAWHKVRGTEKRYLFKRAFASLLPRETLAKVKHGFGLPVADWLRGHAGFRALLRDTLGSARARGRGYFAPGAVDELLQRHETGTTPFYGDILWTVLMLELWHRRHGDPA